MKQLLAYHTTGSSGICLLAVAEGTSHFDLKIIFCFKQIPIMVPVVNAAQERSRPSDLQSALLVYKPQPFLRVGLFFSF